MTEPLIRDYFDGLIDADRLMTERQADKQSPYYMQIDAIDNGTYQLTTEHLTKLCADVLDGNLTINYLDSIAFILIGSDFFYWDTEDGKIISEVLFEWNNPDINYPLTLGNVQEWSNYLNGQERKMNLSGS